MANPTAEATANIAKANAALGGFAKKLQLTTIMTKIADKAFGPFFDLFVKGKQYMQLAGELTEGYGDTVEETGEKVEVATGYITAMLKGLRGIVMILVQGMGIALAFMGILMLLGVSFGELG